MASNIAVRLIANGEALVAETSRSVNAMKATVKNVSQEMGQSFSEDIKKGLREAEVAARASFKSINDVVASATKTNGAIQFDVAGAKAAAQASQDRLEKLQALARAHDAVIAKEGQASAATRTYALAIAESIREETQNIDILNSKAATLERLQAELGQTASAQGKVNAVSGQARAGMQQLSFQISDVATSFAGGINPMVIFAQQGSQVVQSIALMRGSAGGLVGFLSGPWGAAIMGAVTVLGIFASKSDEATKSTDILSGSVDMSKLTYDEQRKAVNEAIEALQRMKRTQLENAEAARKNAIIAIYQTSIEIQRTKAFLESTSAQAQAAFVASGGNLIGAVAAYTRMDDLASARLAKLGAEQAANFRLLGLLQERVTIETNKETEKASAAREAATRKEESAQRALNKEREKSATIVKQSFLKPVDGPITSGFGWRTHPVTGKKSFHGGIDLGVPVGTNVRAPAAGVVTQVDRNPINGLFVKMKHGAGTETMYLHLDKADVVEGQVLSAGEYFAKSGNSGRSTGPHLDYRVRRNNKDVNPNSGPFPTDPAEFSAAQVKFTESAEKSLERQEEAHKRMSAQIAADIDNLKTIAAVEKLRADGHDLEAEKVQALAQYRGQYKEVLEGEPAVAAAALGITEDQLNVLRDMLKVREQLTIAGIENRDQEKRNLDATEKQQTAQREALKELRQKREQQREDEQQKQMQQMRDLASFYERAFRSGGKSIWGDFKQLGRRVLSELAAQTTLSFLSNIGGGSGGSGGGIGGLFNNLGNLFKSGGTGAAGGGGGGTLSGLGAGLGLGNITSALGPIAAGFSLNQAVAKLFGADQKKHGMLLSLLGGPILPALIGSTLRGSATLNFANGSLGVGATRGNSSSRIASSSGAVGSLADMLESVAESLGGSISGAGAVSVGMRKKNYVVDTTGKGRTKGSGVLSFKTEQEAIEAAFRDALQDGVINGISAASQRILSAGGDLQKAIQKAAMIESIPKALKARMNPVGAALDAVNEKWDKMIAALKEGGATAEQMADAEKLYRLERADALKAANDNLKEFIDSLNFGSSSNYSLPDQLASLRADLDLYLGKIASGDFAGVDQQRYLQLAGQDLEILREIDGSGAGYFSRVDELRTATQRLADGLSASTAEAARDPFAELTAASAAETAANTLAAADILGQQTLLLQNINLQLQQLNGGTIFSDFIGTDRNFVSEA
jgi:murein DD-endopeptidase MepM/ murein hydrolase activator NlpD